MSAADAQDEVGEEIFYVAEKELADIQVKLKDGKDITQEDIDKLTSPEEVPDDTMMVPVDLRGVGEEFDDIEAMVEKLGTKSTAEAFVRARTYFKEHEKDGEDAAKPMTAAEWRSVLEDDLDADAFDREGEEEEIFHEGEEEEFYGEEGEEENPEEGADGDEAEEPAAKKAKTD